MIQRSTWRLARRRTSAAILLALTLTLLLPGAAAAQTAPSIVETSIDRTDFPRTLGFSALVDNGESLESAVFFYQVPPEGAITRREAEVSTGDVTRLEVTVPTNTGVIYIPPGADIDWWWALTGTDGETVETERTTFRYADPRYVWQLIEDEMLQIYYYEDESIAEALHVVGREALQRMSALLDVEIDFPARIYLWANSQDALGVERVESDTFEQLIFTGGTRVLADLVHVFSPQPWIVAHELTHVLTKVAGERFTDLPAWLDEGTATYAEVDWRSRRGRPLQAALDGDRILSVRSIGSSTNTPGDVDLFYGESADIVTALIDEFGEDTFAELFRVFKAGTTVDNALLAVYGFDREGLDAFYRENRGLEPREAVEDRSTRIEDEPIGATDATGQAEQSAQAQSGESAGQAEATGEEAAEAEAEAQADEEGAARDESQVSARQEEVEEWNNTLRLGPRFGPGDGFAWEAVVTGVGGGALLVSLVLLFIVLGRGPQTAAAPAGPASAHWQPPAPPAAGPAAAMPPAPAGGSGGVGTETQVQPWSGWRVGAPTSDPQGGSAPEGDAPDGDASD